MQFDRLLDFADWIAERGREARGEGVYRPSDEACHYCPLKRHGPGLCAARDRWLADMIGDPAALPTAVTPYLRGQLAAHAGAIREWLAEQVEQSQSAALAGNPDPGTKLVRGTQGDRQWADAFSAWWVLDDALGKAAYAPPPAPKILSPAQAEKALKPRRRHPGDPEAWAALSEIITRAPAGPVLVSINDNRPEYRRIADDVDDLEDLD